MLLPHYARRRLAQPRLNVIYNMLLDYWCLLSSFEVTCIRNVIPARSECVRRVSETHDNRHISTPAHASYTVGDSVRLRGGIVAAALLWQRAKSDAAWLTGAATLQLGLGLASQKSFGCAGSCPRWHEARYYVL